MAKRVNSFIFRVPFFKAQNGKTLYNFEMQNFEYSKQLSQNFFLFSFLQNELYYLGYKVLNVKVLPKGDSTISINAYLLNNFIRFFSLRFKKIKKLFFFFRMCHFFFMHSRLIRRTLKRLRSHFIKYGYKKGYKLHKKYFQGVKQGFVLIQPGFFKLSNIFHSFYMVKTFSLGLLGFNKMNTGLLKCTGGFKLLFLYSMLTRLYYSRSRYVCFRGDKQTRKNFKKKLLASVLKEKATALALSHKLEMVKLFNNPNIFLKKKRFNYGFIPALFKLINRHSHKQDFLCRLNSSSYRLKIFIFYKVLTKKMLAHSFLARSLSVKYVLQNYLRGLFKKDVNINFMHMNFRRYILKNKNNKRVSNIIRKKQTFIKKKQGCLPLLQSINFNKRFYDFSSIRKQQSVVLKYKYYYAIKRLKKFIKYSDSKKLYRKYPDFRKYYFYFLMGLYYGDAKLFNLAFCKVFKYLKIHKFFLLFFTNEITRFLMLPIFKKRISGVHVQIRGKLDGSDRRKTVRIAIGAPVKPQLINNNFSYNQSAVETYTGSFGVRVWLKLNGFSA